MKRVWFNCSSLPCYIQSLMENLVFEEYSKNAAQVRMSYLNNFKKLKFFFQTDQELGQLLHTADTKPRL